MPTNYLSDAKCRAIKPGEKLSKTYDGGGLHLACTTLGAKVWGVAYRLAGKPQTISLGPYPAVGLAEARSKRDELKTTLRDGGDPMAPRRALRGGMTLAHAPDDKTRAAYNRAEFMPERAAMLLAWAGWLDVASQSAPPSPTTSAAAASASSRAE